MLYVVKEKEKKVFTGHWEQDPTRAPRNNTKKKKKNQRKIPSSIIYLSYIRPLFPTPVPPHPPNPYDSGRERKKILV